MRPVTFVICAAGRGARFRDNGINLPKPLIRLNGKTMLERSIEALELNPQDQLIIITLKEDQIQNKFKSSHPVTWIEIEQLSGGQLETFLHAKSIIQHEDIVIYNCDTYFTAPGLRNLIETSQAVGIIPCSIQPGESWSFCKIDPMDNVVDVAEKIRISDWASVGYYYFKGKDKLFAFAQAECQSIKAHKESYVAPLYNRYLQENLNIKMARVHDFLPFGTIDQVEKYWGIDFDTLKKQNT